MLRTTFNTLRGSLFLFFPGAMALLLISCGVQSQPPSPGAFGIRDVPFVQTFNFNFRTGSGPILPTSLEGGLQVVSGADLFTLLSSAQDIQLEHRGVVIGRLLFSGQPVSDVALKLTDQNGSVVAIRMEGRKERDANGLVLPTGRLILPDGSDCPSAALQVEVDRENGIYICTTATSDVTGSLYYNSPGAVPDFSNNLGTSASGGFTIFNVPKGEVYLWTARGARGNGRITVFTDPDSASLGTFQVLPIPIAAVGVTGAVVEADNQSVSVPLAAVSINAPKEGIFTSSDKSGIFTISRIGSNGSYLMKVSKAGHFDTYAFLDTPLDQVVSPAFQITRTATIYRTAFLQDRARNLGAILDPAKGILTGRVTGPDGTPQQCAVLTVTAANGDPLPSVDYLDPQSAGGCTDPSAQHTGAGGEFFVYNLPSGPIFARYVADLGENATEKHTGGEILDPLPGGVFVRDLLNSGNGAPFSLTGRVVSSVDETTAVPDATIEVLGESGSLVFSAGSSASSPGSYSVSGLVAGQPYLLKVSASGYRSSYQTIGLGSIGTQQNLIAVPASETAEILGTAIDTVTGKGAAGLTIQATDLSGTFLGTATSTDFGKFNLVNVPPGRVNLQVVSQDDGGNGVVRVFQDGVTLVNFIATKALPQKVNYSGTVRDLNQDPVNGARLSVMGKNQQINASGAFSLPLESNGRFLVKATKDDSYHPSYNDQVRTFLFDRSNADLFIPSRTATEGILGTKPDSLKGIVGGTAVSNDFVAQLCAVCGSGTKGVLGFFNQDTILDRAVLDGGLVKIFFGNADGDFISAPAPSPYAVGNGASDIVSADFNRDGFPDLAVANSLDNSLTILMGSREGNFSRLETGATPYFLIDENQAPDPTAQVPSPIALAVGDFSGDQIPDLAVVSRTGNALFILLGVGNGSFTRFDPNQNLIQEIATRASPTAIFAADLNLDGRIDLAVTAEEGNGKVMILLGGGNGSFQELSDNPAGGGIPIDFAVGSSPSAITVGEFNGDGRPDLAVLGKGDGTLSVLLGLTNSTQIFQTPAIIRSAGPSPLAITPLDVNGDGRTDLAVINNNGLSVFLGAGDGTFSAGPTVSAAGAASLLVGDLNRDGFIDLVIVGSTIQRLMGGENPLSGISVHATDSEGKLSGEVFYFADDGTWVSSSTQDSTGLTGRFIIFNVDPGMTQVRAMGGGSGNQMVTVLPDGYTHLSLRVINLAPFSIPVSGTVLDPVGPSPGGVGVGNVFIKFLGTLFATTSLSDADPQKQGRFTLNDLPANSEFIVKMCFTPPGSQPGCPEAP